jgi:glycosyltransferase involved in cell wall biosynthesis
MLKRCLLSLYEQTCDLVQYEVIVIDNNSTDQTHTIVDEFLGYPNFRYYLEIQQGLSYARNRGLTEAKGLYIAYLDDDVLAPPEYCGTAIGLIEKTQLHLDGFGGPLFPFYTTPKPDWFEDQYAIQMGKKGEPYYLEPGQSFIGANMVWDQKLLKLINGFRVDLGYIGDVEFLGEETDAFIRAWQQKASARFLNSPDLSVKHWCPPEKMTLSNRIRRNFNVGLSRFKISGPRVLRIRLVYVFQNLYNFLKGSIRAILNFWKYSLWQKWVFCEWSPQLIYLGEACGALGLQQSKKLSKRR